MIDRSISKQYRWTVKSRLAVLEYVGVYGIKPAAARFGLDQVAERARELASRPYRITSYNVCYTKLLRTTKP